MKRSLAKGANGMDNKVRGTIYYYSGTHWDREWYQTFQGFRYRLVGIMNELLDVLESDPEFRVFHLDGQTIPLEDYMEIEPANRERLARMIAGKRIEIGPWYVMPDELLLSGESLIRNLMRGHAIGRDWGAEVWKFGNVCDVFGHIAQLPQIFQGFGIRYAMVGRGTNEHSCPAHFRWQSPDGSELIAFKLPDDKGYGSFYQLVISRLGEAGLDSEAAEKLVRNYIDHERTRSPIPVTLVMDSFDHEPLHKETPQYLDLIRRLYPEAEVKHVSLTEMGGELEAYKDGMPVIMGELYEPAKVKASYIHLITHTLSSRYPLKQANDQCQTLLEKWVEPLAAIAALEGYPIQSSYVEMAYKYLLANHAHDSICGCSIDQVHKDMEYRFDQVKGIAHQIIGDVQAKERLFRHTGNRSDHAGAAALSGAEGTATTVEDHPEASEGTATTVEARPGAPEATSVPPSGDDLILRLWNPLPFPRSEVITADIDFPRDYPYRYQEPFGYEEKNSFRILDFLGNEIPYGLVSMRRGYIIRHHGQHQRRVDRHTVSLKVELPAMGTAEYRVVPFDRASRYLASLSSHPREAENEYIRLRICDDGTLSILDKRSQRNYEGLCGYLDDGEIGDGWYHANPAEDRLVSSQGTACSIERIENSPSRTVFRVTLQMRVPKQTDWGTHGISRSEEYATLAIVSRIGLSQGEAAVDIETTVDNTARDHRLRLMLPTGINTSKYDVNQAFAFVERRTGVREDTADWKECDVPEKQTGGIVAKRHPGGEGLAFISAAGIHECAGLDDEAGTLAVTLFRSFRKTVMTNGEEGGQLLGNLYFKYRLSVFGSGTSCADLIREQDKLQAGVRHISYPAAPGYAPAVPHSYFQLTGSDICLSVIKRPQSGEQDTVIIRVYNVSGSASTGQITCFRPIAGIREVNLNEEEAGDEGGRSCNGSTVPPDSTGSAGSIGATDLARLSANSFTLQLDAWQIKTFKVCLASGLAE
jgi:alpha-mannosidase